MFSTAEIVTLALCLVLAVVLGLIGYQRYQAGRVKPEERERLRRSSLAATGKMGDATLLEIRDNLVVYSYEVRGVAYTATQDLSLLDAPLPADPDLLVGPVLVKYDPKNPANSIVVSEEWSGLRAPQQVTRRS